MPTTNDQILSRIHHMGAGHAFAPGNLLQLGSREMVDVTLSPLVSSSINRQSDRSLHDLGFKEAR